MICRYTLNYSGSQKERRASECIGIFAGGFWADGGDLRNLPPNLFKKIEKQTSLQASFYP